MKRTILIADDEPAARTFLQKLLEPEGYDIVQAESGEQAIALSQSLRLDAFILDIEMPKISGIAVCKTLRAMEQYRSTPIIFLTGSGDEAMLEAAFAAGG